MADAAVAAPDPARRAPAPAGGQGSTFFTILRVGLMWMAMTYFSGNKKANPGGGPAASPEQYSFPSFPKGSLVDFYCFISERTNIRHYDMADLIWSERGVEMGGPTPLNHSYLYEPSQHVQKNGSVYLHVLFAKANVPINPKDPDYDESLVFGRLHSLIAYHKKPKNDSTVNLLSGDALPTAEILRQEANESAREIISFFKPNLTIHIVDSFTTYPKSAIPPQVAPWLQFDEGGNYFPIVHFNEFWLLRDKLVMMNESVENVTLNLEFGTTSQWWWQLVVQMEKSFEMQTTMGMTQEGESDELKRVLLEGNPYLLVLTFFVSMLHTVFDMLAFKSDIGFWKNNKSMEGLSARSVMINAICQLIILLYLFDNETSYVVLFSSFLGVCIEFWKVTKAMDVTVDSKFPFIHFTDRASYTQNKTKEYDAQATLYLSYVLYPLVAGYAVYALMYKSHKSWYSWIINSLVGAVYMFGFILMCPQLYLNYKLKSVAHLPWRQMTYKFLNTIIDDLFAFIIKMPLLHRISVFRDDLIFCIFLYQRWIYRVDKTRVNEFGWAPEAEAEALEQKPDAAEDAGAVETIGNGGEEDRTEAGPKKRAGKGATAGEGAPVGKPAAAAAAATEEKKEKKEKKKGK